MSVSSKGILYLYESVRPLQPAPLFPHHMPTMSIQLKSHRYWGWLARKCAQMFHSTGNRSKTVLYQQLIEKQHLSSRERWLLTLGLYR